MSTDKGLFTISDLSLAPSLKEISPGPLAKINCQQILREQPSIVRPPLLPVLTIYKSSRRGGLSATNIGHPCSSNRMFSFLVHLVVYMYTDLLSSSLDSGQVSVPC